MPEIKYPEFDQYQELAGIFVEGCVDRGDGSSFRARAHAHTSGNNKGWICVRSRKRLYFPDGRTSNLMKHELAHILTGQGHTDVFRAKLRELGGRATLNARKRPRFSHNWSLIRIDPILNGGSAHHFRCEGHCPAHKTVRREGK